MVEQAGALGYFGDARRAAVGTELLERVTASGSLVIRKLGATRAGELAIHRFLSAPSVSCREMLATLAGSTLAATAGRHIAGHVPARRDNAEIAPDGISCAVFDCEAGGWLACRRMRHHAARHVPRLRGSRHRDPNLVSAATQTIIEKSVMI
jgi:hypothetical protein